MPSLFLASDGVLLHHRHGDPGGQWRPRAEPAGNKDAQPPRHQSREDGMEMHAISGSSYSGQGLQPDLFDQRPRR